MSSSVTVLFFIHPENKTKQKPGSCAWVTQKLFEVVHFFFQKNKCSFFVITVWTATDFVMSKLMSN